MKICLANHFPLCYLDIYDDFSRHDEFLDIFDIFFGPRYALKNMSKMSQNSSCVEKYVKNV